MKTKKGFIFENFLKSLDYLKLLKPYFIFSFVLFFLSAVFGILFPGLFVEDILKWIQEILSQTEGLGLTELIAYLMNNNIQSAFMAVFFGVFFAIIPLLIILINGYLLGFVINLSVVSGNSITLWKLFPHGIFEIPAILISVSVGIRLGLFLFLYRGKNKGREFLEWMKNSLRVFIFIVVPLLVIAGIIEGSLIILAA